MRTTFELTPEACRALTTRERERAQNQGRGELLGYLPFLTGLLPAKDQLELERRYGVSAIAATWISAGLLLALAMLSIMVTFAYRSGMAFGDYKPLVETLADLSPASSYLLAESIVRLMSVASHQPMGSLPVVAVALVWHALRGLAYPAPRAAPRPATATPPPVAGHHLLTARDDVWPLPGGGIEILSHLPKDHWTANVTGIEIDGETEAYVLVEREQIQTRHGPRHRFLLERPEHDVLFSSFLRYRPEEVRDVYRAQQRLRTAMWVESLPFLWGLVDPAIQERLAATYDYDPRKWTRWSILASAGLALLLGIRSWGQMLAGAATAGDGVTFVFAAVVLLEAALRWSKLKQGELHGSLLGLPFRPLAVSFLKWE